MGHSRQGQSGLRHQSPGPRTAEPQQPQQPLKAGPLLLVLWSAGNSTVRQDKGTSQYCSPTRSPPQNTRCISTPCPVLPPFQKAPQRSRGLGHLVWSWPMTNVHHQVALFPSWAPSRAESRSKLRGERLPRTDLQGAIY